VLHTSNLVAYPIALKEDPLQGEQVFALARLALRIESHMEKQNLILNQMKDRWIEIISKHNSR
jgi:hypothetical protein